MSMPHGGHRQRNKIPRDEWDERVAEHERDLAQAREDAAKAHAHSIQERPPAAFGYRRCSSQHQAASGLGLEDQRRVVEQYFQILIIEYPGLPWYDWYEDKAESAWSQRLISRPAGKEMSVSLRKGDHVIIPMVDRGFRNTEDLLSTTRLWTSRGVTTHFVCERLVIPNLRAPAYSKLILTLMGAAAEFYSNLISERVKAAKAVKRSRGDDATGIPPRGFIHVGPKGHRRRQPGPRRLAESRQIIDWVLLLKSRGHSWGVISDVIEEKLAEDEGRKTKGRAWREITPKACSRIYQTHFTPPANEAEAPGPCSHDNPGTAPTA